MRTEGDRRLAMHLPETVGVNLIVEGRAVDGHLFGEQLGAGAQFAVHKYGVIVVCCRGIDDLAARFGHGKTNLGAGFKAAFPHVFALGDVQQRTRGKRHGVDGHAVVCAAPAHGWHAVVVGNHFDAGTPIEAAGFLVAGHALDGNGHVDMAESAHLFGDGDGLPLELAGQRDVHEIRAAHSPAHRQGTGKWPCRGGSVFGRLENLDDFAGPEPVVPVVGLVKFDSHEFVGQGEADEHHTTVDMGHTAALVGVSFDTNFSLHHRPFRLRSVRVRHQQRLQSVSS